MRQYTESKGVVDNFYERRNSQSLSDVLARWSACLSESYLANNYCGSLSPCNLIVDAVRIVQIIVKNKEGNETVELV